MLEIREKHDNPNPRLTANVFSRLTFCWLTNLFWYGSNHQIQTKDLYDTVPNDLSEPLGKELERHWKHQVDNFLKTGKKPSLLIALWKTFGLKYLLQGINLFVLNLVLRILLPLTLGALIRHFHQCSTTTESYAYTLASGIILIILMQVLIERHAFLDQSEIGMRARIACSSLIFRKLTKLSSSLANQSTGGLVINLLSNDVAKFERTSIFLHYIWIMPLQLAAITYLIWMSVGYASIIGICVLIVQTIPLQACCGKLISYLRAKVAARTDTRTLLMSELVHGMRVLKMYTWEPLFERLIAQTRKREINIFTVTAYLRGAKLAGHFFTERTTMYFTLLAYVLQGYPISAEKVFAMFQYFNMLQITAANYFPLAIDTAAEVRVSLRRIEKFLLQDEAKSLTTKSTMIKIDSNDAIVMKKVNASWSEKPVTPTLTDLNLVVPRGTLFAVTGPVGSGKSSFTKLILGELRIGTGGELHRAGSLSYASHEPWLFAGTARNNILFGEPYEARRYQRVVEVCALHKDFQRLPSGDRTLLGDRGAGLSGGQKARINLARAVYRNADVYVFDDPMSSLDGQVAESIFKDCINGFLKDKTRILATHSNRHLQEADIIVLLNNGHVEYQGTYDDLKKDEKYLHLIPSNDEIESLPSLEKQEQLQDEEQLTIGDTTLDSKEEDEKAEPKETEEFIAKGKLSKSLYTKYCRAGGSYFVLFLLAIYFLLGQLATSACDYWLAYWVRQEEEQTLNSSDIHGCNAPRATNNRTNPEKYVITENSRSMTSLYIYSILTLACVVTLVTRNIWFCQRFMKASRNLHDRMLQRLLKAPMQFFDRNPSGRIMNRFFNDINVLDELLPVTMLDGLQVYVFMIGVITQVFLIKWWTIFLMLLMAYLFYRMIVFYLATAQNIKRLEGVAKSPVFSHVDACLSGLSTIRSCGAEKIVVRDFDAHQDHHTSAYYLTLATSRAFGLWIELVLLVFIGLITYGFVYIGRGSTYAGNVGLALSQIFVLNGMLQFGIRQSTDVMTQMTNVERVVQFTELEQEGTDREREIVKPSKNWPTNGDVEFSKVCLRYGKEKEPVLKNVNFIVEAGWKVGIVGRTGAGKSSLVSAIFRLTEYEGRILIDGLDTSKIGLTDLRKRISIIPQEPMLFSASLRANLDPFDEHDDAELWSALQSVELNRLFVSLDQSIEPGGGNLSAGQRQLLCLARAVLRRNRIIVLDEATASVDPATDELIQSTIRSKFRDRTVLTIAHRLNTIMDNDKILVMDNGRVVEYDHPFVLLNKIDGCFAKMVQQTGNSTAQYLRDVAEETYKRSMIYSNGIHCI
ncbi:hypothetical protein TKK_0008673 [Trichogramma kaykai]|uniref:Multidrug resistance-associated protein lethal(2)03659 n=1 Tax=Trichogramma kaykai TaxID=54128 RepID=A0ABD2X557_9HYME